METRKLIILIAILCIAIFNVDLTTYAKEKDKQYKCDRVNILTVTQESPNIISQYSEEKDLGVKYIDDRLCVSIGNEIDADVADYIYLKTENNYTIPCIVCDIHEESDTALVNIYANTSRPFITLSDINEDWSSNIKEINVLDENYIDTIRQDIADYAQQFVGNPYVWGSTSLTDGADCSGFVMSIYSNFGIDYLPHDAEAQASYGISVSESEMKPGDLLFYSDDDGGIGHVAIYIGDGQIVHASNSAPYPDGGIKISPYDYRTPTCIRRLI